LHNLEDRKMGEKNQEWLASVQSDNSSHKSTDYMASQTRILRLMTAKFVFWNIQVDITTSLLLHEKFG